jgi:penicillin-binding protein 2
MVDVNISGTGRFAFAGVPYKVAGKTGTAQVVGIKQGEKYDEKRMDERHRDHSLFIAFAPADPAAQPKIALAVLVENGGFGARAAAPIARQVLDFVLLGKVPAAPAGEQDGGDDLGSGDRPIETEPAPGGPETATAPANAPAAAPAAAAVAVPAAPAAPLR